MGRRRRRTCSSSSKDLEVVVHDSNMESEITRAKQEAEHWKLTCLVLRHHNSELNKKYMECCELIKKSRFEKEEGFDKEAESPEKHVDDDSSVVVYKRRKYSDMMEDYDRREKCQCAQLGWEIDDLKYGKERADCEIQGLKTKCLELETRGGLVKMRCNQLELSEREKRGQERITCLEKECAQLKREIDDLKLGKIRDATEFEGLKRRYLELESQEDVSLNLEIKLRKELVDYKSKCESLSAELERKEMELEIQGDLVNMQCNQLKEKIMVLEKETSARGKKSGKERIACLEKECAQLNFEIKDLKYGKQRADDEIEGFKTMYLELGARSDLVKVRCNQLKENFVVLEKETAERVKSGQDRIACLEMECAQLNGEIKDLKLGRKSDAVEIQDLKRKCVELECQETVLLNHEIELRKGLEDYKSKCGGLSAELERKEMELENLLVRNGGYDHELEDYRTKCIGMEKQIKDLIEDGIVVYERETSARERICVLEEVVRKMEANEKETFVQLNREIDDLKLGKKRGAVEIQDLKRKCVEFECQETVSLNHEIELRKALEDYKSKCGSLSAELERKELDLENLLVINDGYDHELQDYKTKCSGMEKQIKDLIEDGIVVHERETSARERIRVLEGVVRKMEANEKETFIQLNKEVEYLKLGKNRDAVEIQDLKRKCVELGEELVDYKSKCGSLSAELEQKELGLENLLVINGEYDHELQDYRTKCIGVEKQIKDLIEEGIVVRERETSARERIRVLEEVVRKMEANEKETFVQLSTENRRLNVAPLTRTKTRLNSTFTPTCKPSSLQVNFHGVDVPDAPPHVNSLSKSAENAKEYFASAVEHQPVLRTQGGVRESTTCIVEISDSEGEKETTTTDKTMKTPKKHLKRPLQEQRGKECDRSFGKDIPLSATMKRCRISDTSISRSVRRRR